MSFDTQRYSARIATLRTLDPNMQIFGAVMHRWSFGPPLSTGEMDRFGGLIGAELPLSYQTFLRECGNGGAGPYYGIQPLEIWEVDGSHPNRPFVLEAPWKEGDPLPDGAHVHDGCVHLAQIGCGYEAFLVVKGSNAGQVWEDYLAGGGEVAKVADDFGEWVHRWADITLANAAMDAIDTALLDPPWEIDDALSSAAKVFDELFDEKPRAWLERAMKAAYEGDAELARSAANRAEELLDLDKWVRARSQLAAIWVWLGELARARAIVAPALELDQVGFQTRAACTVAMALATEGDASEAWQAAREARPFELTPRVRLALAHELAGRSSRADALLSEAAGEVRLFDRGKTYEGNALKRAVYERMVEMCLAHGADGARFAKIAESVPTGPSGWGNPGNTKSW